MYTHMYAYIPELLVRLHEGLGDVPAAELAEVPWGIYDIM